MSDVRISPADVAGRVGAAGTASGIVASDGPVGDADLDAVVSRLSRSVEAFTNPNDGRAPDDDVSAARPDGDVEEPADADESVDAADVIARAHDVHEALQRRLEGAQA